MAISCKVFGASKFFRQASPSGCFVPGGDLSLRRNNKARLFRYRSLGPREGPAPESRASRSSAPRIATFGGGSSCPWDQWLNAPFKGRFQLGYIGEMTPARASAALSALRLDDHAGLGAVSQQLPCGVEELAVRGRERAAAALA